MPLPYHDAHNHLQDEWLAPHLAMIVPQLDALGLRSANVNGTCEDDWPRVAELSHHYAFVKPSFGLHPWDAGNRSPAWREKLEAMLAAHPCAGVGEIGLDRWILERARPDDPRLAGLRRAPLDEQIGVFSTQLELAARDNRPATLHCLDAWGALATALRSARLPARGFLLHAYSGPMEMIAGFADLGAYFSFNGSFLEDRKSRLRDAFRHMPASRLLAETDAPAMPPPEPWRTYKLPPAAADRTVNHPGNIAAAYAGLADLLGLTLPTLADMLAENTARFLAVS